MRTKQSFAFSIALHAVLIGGVIFYLAMPKEEVEEEIVLQLAMSIPEVSNKSEEESKPTSPKPTEPKPTEPNQIQQKPLPIQQPQIPLATKAKPLEPTDEPIKAPAQHVGKEIPVAQKTEPIAKKVEPAPLPVVPQTVPKQNLEEEYLDNHLSAIRHILIKYRKYPTMAVRLKQEGSVRVSFRLKENGTVEDIRIVNGSGFDLLDQNAIDLIEKTAIYFPKPEKPIRITVPLNYKLS